MRAVGAGVVGCVAVLLVSLGSLAPAAPSGRAGEEASTPSPSASGHGVAGATPAAQSWARGSLGDVVLPCYFLRVEPMPDVDRGIVPGGTPTPTPGPSPTSAVARLEHCHPAPALHPIGPPGP